MSLAELLRDKLALSADEPLFHSDDPRGPPADPVPAAVLIALTERPEPGVILTVRRPDLRTHAGQIAFPGGRIDPGETATQAALREAWEEVELPPSAVMPVAELGEYRTITGFAVTSVLATIPPDLPLTPHDGEVADWFEAPLAHLLDQANHVYESVLFEGLQRHYYRIEWKGRNIWGATAAMLVNLSRRLRWD